MEMIGTQLTPVKKWWKPLNAPILILLPVKLSGPIIMKFGIITRFIRENASTLIFVNLRICFLIAYPSTRFINDRFWIATVFGFRKASIMKMLFLPGKRIFWQNPSVLYRNPSITGV